MGLREPGAKRQLELFKPEPEPELEPERRPERRSSVRQVEVVLYAFAPGEEYQGNDTTLGDSKTEG
jgi:hypothetical protein